MAKEKSDIYKQEKMGVCTARLQKCRWVIIQPGERLNGIQEVSGSIPLISTKNTDFYRKSRCFSNFLRQNSFRISFYLMRYLIDNIYIAIATDFQSSRWLLFYELHDKQKNLSIIRMRDFSFFS